MSTNKIIKIDLFKPDSNTIDLAVSTLKNGGTIVLPTDTFYALGADAINLKSYEKIFNLKKRDKNKAVILLADDLDMIKYYVSDFNDLAMELCKSFLPGKLTLVFNPSLNTPRHLLSKENKIAFRIPDFNICRNIICKLGKPITGTSANLSGMKPAKSVKEVKEYFCKGIDLIIDGGICESEKESTIIDVTQYPPEILRLGAISKESLAIILKQN